MTPETNLPFRNRIEAGRLLANALLDHEHAPGSLVLALPRGGVPVAVPVARALRAELDLIVVRKLGVPGHEELAMGAIAIGGIRVMNDDLVRTLRIPQQEIDAVVRREQRELVRRQQRYRGARPEPEVAGRELVLVDDGLATGATMRAAVSALRSKNPAKIVVAIPVAPPDTVSLFESEADRIVCLATPEPFMGVGCWYREFSQTSDHEVRQLLAEFWADTDRDRDET